MFVIADKTLLPYTKALKALKTESYIEDDQFKIRIEERKMVEEFNFETEEIHLSILEKAIIVILWLLVMVVGNLLLIGLIQFERLSGHTTSEEELTFKNLSGN